MKKYLLPAAVCFFAAAPLQSASAAEAYPSGSGVTQTCIDHMAELTSEGDALTQCIRELKSEYFGVNGVSGKGPKYRKKEKSALRSPRWHWTPLRAHRFPAATRRPGMRWKKWWMNGKRRPRKTPRLCLRGSDARSSWQRRPCRYGCVPGQKRSILLFGNRLRLPAELRQAKLRRCRSRGEFGAARCAPRPRTLVQERLFDQWLSRPNAGL